MSLKSSALLRLVGISLASALACFAQAERGGITGAITDSSGARMAKVRISATNQDTGTASRVERSMDGFYKIPYLAAGKYNMVVESAGFATAKISDVPVQVGQITTIDSVLRPGSVRDEVTVTANALGVEQVSSSLGYVASARQIIELPTGRSPYSLLTLSPGVIAVGNAGTGRSWAVAAPTLPPSSSTARKLETILLSITPTRPRRKQSLRCASLPTASRLNMVAPQVAWLWLQAVRAATPSTAVLMIISETTN